MTTTTIPVDSDNSSRSNNKVTMMNQREGEDESTALLAPAAADHGRYRSICGVMKKQRKQVDYLPAFSLRKIHLFRSSSSIVSDSIEPHVEKQESSVAETYMKLFREYNQSYPHPKPQFVLIHGAEIV